MSNLNRIKDIFRGVLMLLCSLLLMLAPGEGYYLVTMILGFSMMGTGIRDIFYYVTMARHMVGGKSILYKGIILMDVGLFSLTMVDIPKVYVIGYLLVIHLFAGAVDILKAFEARKIESPSWKISLLYGVCNLLVAVLTFVGGVLQGSVTAVVYSYSAGLLYSALVRIGASFRRTAIVYIP